MLQKAQKTNLPPCWCDETGKSYLEHMLQYRAVDAQHRCYERGESWNDAEGLSHHSLTGPGGLEQRAAWQRMWPQADKPTIWWGKQTCHTSHNQKLLWNWAKQKELAYKWFTAKIIKNKTNTFGSICLGSNFLQTDTSVSMIIHKIIIMNCHSLAAAIDSGYNITKF